MITDEQIEAAKKSTQYTLSGEDTIHEHNDCIRFAYEWLDAQTKTKGALRHTLQIKHLIERWAGRYVSTYDVDVAANLHPDIHGKYPHYNISSKLTNPSRSRIQELQEALSQGYDDRHDLENYTHHE